MSLEAQLRRVAKREGYVIGKSRRRNPQALDYGKYWLVDAWTNTATYGDGLTLDEVEEALLPYHCVRCGRRAATSDNVSDWVDVAEGDCCDGCLTVEERGEWDERHEEP